MARVSNTEVRAILTTAESDALSDGQIDAAIASATIKVDDLATAPCYLADADGGVSRAKQVELNLSADIATTTTGGGAIKSEKIGDASTTYSSQDDGGSNYFRTASMLDCSGQLANSGKIVAQMFSVGCH